MKKDYKDNEKENYEELITITKISLRIIYINKVKDRTI